jgi:hypothetical protein
LLKKVDFACGGACAPAGATDPHLVNRWCESLIDRLPSGSGDPKPNGYRRLGASVHGFAFGSCKSGADEVGDHVASEAIGPQKQRLGSAMGATAKQR